MELLAKHTNHEKEVIERDIMRPKYFDPYAAIEYGIIDKVRRRCSVKAGTRGGL